MLVYVRPSNEALLRARVPGAQDQRGCPSHLLLSFSPLHPLGEWPRLPLTARFEQPSSIQFILQSSLPSFHRRVACLASPCARCASTGG